jgi:two-component system CheB/CheR fusion protein
MSSDGDARATPQDLVVIGASAGGVEALATLTSLLPAGFPAPIVIAQHIAPDRPSMLGSVLERRSTLPVKLVEDEVLLEEGTIYVVPPNQHVEIRDGMVTLKGDHGNRPRPSIDLLLASAAKWYGERLIAVILTGSGTDGAAGAIEVKNAGGIVIIQNPATARYPSMPHALPPTAVDQSADLEEIPRLLHDLLARTPQPERAADDDALGDVLRLVSRHTDIDVNSYKPRTILRRIGRRMAVTHADNLREYASYLEAHPSEVSELARAFLIKVTGFFRDGEAFAFLRENVIPELVQKGRENGNELRFWSAGCATGEEPYSLALLVADHLGGELPDWTIKIFATDVDERVIEFARKGVYPASAMEEVPDNFLTRYFEKLPQGYRVSKVVRQMVVFGQQDLSRGVPFPRIDLIVCRNLLIYFKPELQQHILDQFAYSLARNGYLFLGKAETTRPSQASFEIVNKRWKIYRCTNCPIGPRVARGRAPVTLPVSHQPPAAARRADAEGGRHEVEGPPAEGELGLLRRFNDLILRQLPLGVVVVDRNYRIVTISGAARRMLGVRDVGVDHDFLHAVRGLPYARVRSAIDTAFRERTTVTLKDLELEPAAGGDGRFLSFTVGLIHQEDQFAELAVVSASDMTEQVHTWRRLKAVQAEQSHLVDELSVANKRLSEMNKNLQDSNEELQAANEELMLTQEELQASNEEFEATNEELQATNEELETNNEELQATNEELQATNEEREATNDELTARTTELQQLTESLDARRALREDVVELAPLAVAALRGPHLVVELCNSRFAAMVSGPDPLGSRFEEAFTAARSPELFEAVREAYRQGVTRVLPNVPTRLSGRSGGITAPFEYTIVPIHDSQGSVDGVIVYADGGPG